MTETVKALFRRRGPGKPDEFVFTKLDGERMNDISNPFTKVVKRMGFNDGIEDPRQRVCFHTLRHYADSRIMPTSYSRSLRFLIASDSLSA